MLSEPALRDVGLKAVSLKQDAGGRPLLVELPRRVEAMEQAAPYLFHALRKVSVTQLKALTPTLEYVGLIDALIVVRQIMGGEGSC